MTVVRCWQGDCKYWRDGFCRARQIEYDPDLGCMTMEERAPLGLEEGEEIEGWEEEGELGDEVEWPEEGGEVEE